MAPTNAGNTSTGLVFRSVVLVLASALVLIGATQIACRPRVAIAYQEPTPPDLIATDAVTATVRFAQDVITATVNVPVVVELVIEDAEFLGGWQTTLTFDPAQLQVSSVALGDFMASQGRSQSLLGPWPDSAGLMTFGGYTVGTLPGVSGSGVLARITMIPQAAGNAALNLDGTMLTLLDGSASVQLQPHNATGAEIHISSPLAVTLESFDATSQSDGILVTWVTVSEIDNRGFNLYRAPTPVAPETHLAYIPSQSPGNSQGFAYEWLDSDVIFGETYYYWLEDIDMVGNTTMHGPISATHQAPTAISLVYLETGQRNKLHLPMAIFVLSAAIVVTILVGLRGGQRSST